MRTQVALACAGPVGLLLRAERLPAGYAAVVERWWRPLARLLAERRRAAGRPLVVGIQGPQGSGKSTLSLMLERVLAPELGLRAAVLSLDDYYLARAERRVLAEEVHPLFATRGPPGTHDYAALAAALDALVSGRPGALRMRRFDKAADEVVPAADWPSLALPVDLVLFEGWCVGVGPQDEAALAAPVNALERLEDPDGVWRRHANAVLARDYQPLFARIDVLISFALSSMEEVVRNRMLQESKLQHGGMDEAAIRRFVAHFERLTCHAAATLPEVADVVVRLGPDHAVEAVRGLSPLSRQA